MSLMFRIRLSKGLLWKRPYWLPTLHEVLLAIGATLAATLIFGTALLLVAQDAKAQADKARAESEQMLQDCLDSKAVIVIGDKAIRCKNEWIPIK